MTATAETASPTARLPSLPAASPMNWRGPGAHLAMLVGLILLLLIPLAMIADQIRQRELRHREASSDIAQKWGDHQQLTGPILRVPYETRVTNADGTGSRSVESFAYFLPESLSVDGRLQTQIRRRGLFQIPVYTTDLRMQGDFRAPSRSEVFGDASRIDWSRAELLLGISDVHALQAGSRLQWNQQPLDWQPSTGGRSERDFPGIHAQVPLACDDRSCEARDLHFDLQLQLQGSEWLTVAPSAGQTQVHMQADWPSPSFQGRYLPVSSHITDVGFQADWSVSYLGRDVPQQWVSGYAALSALSAQSLGVSLNTPIDPYRLAERLSKYAVLTVALTFLTVWMLEIVGGQRLHVIQYALIGAAICLFGLLQLALSEAIGFTSAYVLAAAGVIGQVALYARAILLRPRGAWSVAAVLAGLYALMYVILLQQDYALLGGSLTLFVALATVMWLTRKLQWSGRTSASTPGDATVQ